MEVLCDKVLKCEDRLHRTLFLNYESSNHRHHLFCKSCQSAAPIVSALDECVADEQFRRMRLYLANLVECLDFSDLKVKKLAAGLALPRRDGSSDQDLEPLAEAMLAEETLKEGFLWRAFLLVNYLPYVADMFVYCPKPRTPEQAVNPWTALRSGDGYQGAVRFVQSLTRQEFEAAVFAHEILSAIPDYPDCLAFRWNLRPMEAPQVPSCQEGLQPIPGYLRVREQANNGDWAAFVNHTLAEKMPWWGFSMLEGLFKLAAKAATTALMECGLEGASGSVYERLENIENQTHAVYGAQRPMWELQEETKRAVDQVANQQKEQATQQKEQTDILQQIRAQLRRPTKRHAEASLRGVLGDAVSGLSPTKRRSQLWKANSDFFNATMPIRLSSRFNSPRRSNASCVRRSWNHSEVLAGSKLIPSLSSKWSLICSNIHRRTSSGF